jgi:hypothetical protein
LKYKDEREDEREDKRGVGCKNKPTREAEITDSKWTIRKLLIFKCFKTPIT